MLRTLFFMAVSSFLLAVFFLSGIKLFFTPFILELIGINPIAVEYINGIISLEEFKRSSIQGFQFTAPEVLHFQDVKVLFDTYINPLFTIGILLTLFMFFLTPETLKDLSYYAFTISLLIVFSITLALTMGEWKPLTAYLHNLVFPDGNWRFSKQSLTIQLYPRTLMQGGLIGSFFFASITLFGLHLHLKRKLLQ